MRATVLVDNIGNDLVKGEWGLSILIENQDEKIILDMGSTNLFVQNAKKMGINLDDIDYGVLSHAHYDHADGMKYFFDLNKSSKVYLQNSCKNGCFYKKWFFRKYIGIEKNILKKYTDRISFVSGDFKLNKGVYLISHKTKDLDKIGKLENMYIKTKDKFIPDSFAHEQSLVFDTPDGLVIFNSCSHGGADNIINEVAADFPGKKIKAIVGGFHLYKKSEKAVREISQKIKATGVEQIYTGHCTGENQFNIMKDELGDMVHQLKVGLVMEF